MWSTDSSRDPRRQLRQPRAIRTRRGVRARAAGFSRRYLLCIGKETEQAV